MVHIIYPYNEILPLKKAHDIFIFNECAYLAHEKAEVTLLCGHGSAPDLFSYYKTPQSSHFKIRTLPIVRKNNPLGLSSNLPFFFFTQSYLKKMSPDVVILSVLKQAQFHLKRKIASSFYIYEVHQLEYYPEEKYDEKKFLKEKEILGRADLVVTTTKELSTILKNPPYSLKVPIETLPLAVNVDPLSTPKFMKPFNMAYVGQLYASQGISLLLKAFSQTPSFFHLKIIGGKSEEITEFRKECAHFSLMDRVSFFEFQPPSRLTHLLENVHAFVAPFVSDGKMRYVAHTKLHEYADWKRPVIAPQLSVVQECFPDDRAVTYFISGNVSSLTVALEKTYQNYEKLLGEIPNERRFTWNKRAKDYLELINCFRPCAE